jgi:predicted Zn finger-like uncharacterized protein
VGTTVDDYLAATRAEARRERLAQLLPGGSPARPYLVASAAVIEQHATRSMPCPHCGGEHRVLEHERPTSGLRRVDVRCRNCGSERALWFAIVPPLDELN